MTQTEFYRQLFAWLEIQKADRSKPWLLLKAKDIYREHKTWDDKGWELTMMAIVAHWKDTPENVNRLEVPKAILLAQTYDVKYLGDITIILAKVQKYMADNKLK